MVTRNVTTELPIQCARVPEPRWKADTLRGLLFELTLCCTLTAFLNLWLCAQSCRVHLRSLLVLLTLLACACLLAVFVVGCWLFVLSQTMPELMI